jgi:hypothetical protein
MKRISLIAPICFAVAMSASAHPAHTHYINAKSLAGANAAKDAAKDFKAGHCRLFATQGVGWLLVDSGMSIDQAKKKYEIIYVDGTSDAISSGDLIAWPYVKVYNPAAVKNCGAAK